MTCLSCMALDHEFLSQEPSQQVSHQERHGVSHEDPTQTSLPCELVGILLTHLTFSVGRICSCSILG